MNLLGNQIALRCRRRPDMNRLIGHLDVHGVAVRIRIDRDRRNPHPPGGLDDAAGYLAAIGDQDLLEHAAFPSEVFPFLMGFSVTAQAVGEQGLSRPSLMWARRDALQVVRASEL